MKKKKNISKNTLQIQQSVERMIESMKKFLGKK